MAAGLDRRSPVIALGGGVVGDVAGFAAASYLRGVPFVQVPTSLLAMVDASVGGKTGVDLPQGKNLVGAFKQPALVADRPGDAQDPALRRVPQRPGRGGQARHDRRPRPVRGHGRACELLAAGELVARAVRVKVAVVEEDPFEQGRRAVLNLGHTFGHAFEILSGYRLRHGEAVASAWPRPRGWPRGWGCASRRWWTRVDELLDRLGLPIRAAGLHPKQIMAAMATDKKRVGSRLRFVLPRAVGDVDVFDDVPTSRCWLLWTN